MYLVYSLLLTVGFILLLPRFLLDALRHGKYVAGFGQRLGRLEPIESKGRPVIWLHCVSVGETQAARPLVKGLRERFSDHSLVVSTITRTGHKLASELFQHEAKRVFYFPFDWRWTVRRSLKAVRPSAVLIMETEIWPGFLRECSAQQIPVAIVNGRLSQQSFRRYKWIKSFVSRVLNCLSMAVMQAESDAERIRGLGLDSTRTFVSGNFKFDVGTVPANNSLAAHFKQRFGINNEAPLILAASTHAPEEGVMLEALQLLRTRISEKSRLILAPRHPERFADVAALIQRSGFTWTSQTAPTHLLDQSCDVILLDTIGELPALYSAASVVFVGGSIVKKGGHNIVEPAASGAAIVTGWHTHNFEAIVSEFLRARALIQLPPLPPEDAATELSSVFAELLQDRRRRDELGHKSRNLVEKNRGAVNRTLNLLEPLLSRH